MPTREYWALTRGQMLHVNMTSFNPHNSLERWEQVCHFTKEEKMKLKVFKQLSQNSIVCGDQDPDLEPGPTDFKKKKTTLFSTTDPVTIQQSAYSGDVLILVFSNFSFLNQRLSLLLGNTSHLFPWNIRYTQAPFRSRSTFTFYRTHLGSHQMEMKSYSHIPYKQKQRIMKQHRRHT